ncbi:MAG: NnrS family protein [Pseudomonadota bacterium]|jgi:uncharacterized protein involved in response to NO|nr:NnrS family protein [Rhodocyclaceae bacterium]
MLTALLRGLVGVSHPVWMCGLRPFFLLATLAAPALMLVWLAFLGHGLPLPPTVGGPFVWHAHELLFGFALAATAGFLLTVVPEFTGGGDFTAVSVRWLAFAWLLGRAGFWSSGWLGAPALAVSGLAHLALLCGLGWLAAPRLWRDPERKHLAFLWAVAGLAVCVAGFHVDALRGEHPARWLHAALGVYMMLIVVAMSRVSMRIVNHAIEEAGVVGVEYRARPPRRNLATFCIGLYTAAEFFLPESRISGWLALAAAAALLNLLNDWHIGRALFSHRPLMLYGVYAFMAAGYAIMGAALVFATGAFSAGRHLLAVGALGLAIFAVMGIAGRAHCGMTFETRQWLPIGAVLLAAAALARALAAWPGANAPVVWLVSGLLWSMAFGLYAGYMAPLLLTARADGLLGCKGTAIP